MNLVTLRAGGVQIGPTLRLKRIAVYLRFVYGGRDFATLDALDQLDDEPQDSEDIIVAKCVKLSRFHVERVVDGRRVGEWFKEAVYVAVQPQPARELVDNTDGWRKWCYAEQAKQEEAK